MPLRTGPPPKPRDRRLDSAAKPPLVAPPRRRQESSDDLTALQADDAKEAQLRAAAAQIERERAATRAEAVARAQAEAERDRNAAEVGRLSVVAASPPAPRAPKSEAPPDSKGTVRAQGNGWKIAVPVGALAVLAAPVTALIQHFVALDRSNAELIKAVAGYEERDKARDAELKKTNDRITELTVVVARMSGFLESAFPKVGLNVKAEAGAQAVELKSDQVASAPPRRAQVTVTTKIPAPAPPKGR